MSDMMQLAHETHSNLLCQYLIIKLLVEIKVQVNKQIIVIEEMWGHSQH